MYHMKLREILKYERNQENFDLAIDNIFLQNSINKIKKEAKQCECKKLYGKYYKIKSENEFLSKNCKDLKEKYDDLKEENSNLKVRIKSLENEKLEVNIQKQKIKDQFASLVEDFEML